MELNELDVVLPPMKTLLLQKVPQHLVWQVAASPACIAAAVDIVTLLRCPEGVS